MRIIGQSILQKILPVTYLIFVVAVIYNYFVVYPLINFYIKFIELSIALVLFLSAFLIGKKIFKLLSFKFNSALEESVFSTGLGLAVFILGTFLIGIAGLYYRPLIFFLLFIPIVIFYKDLIEFFVSVNRFINSAFSFKWDLLKVVFLFVTVFALAFVFVSCFAPPTYYDSLVYHLSLPSMYINSKKIFFVPFNLYSHFPQNMEMLYTIGLLICSEIVPNLISFFMFILTAVAIFSFLRLFITKTSALVAIFLMSTAPTVMLLSCSSYVESGLAFFTFLAIYSFILFLLPLNLPLFKGEIKWGFLILSGFFSAFAFGTKYTGIITPIVITLLILFKSLKTKSIATGLKQSILLNLIVIIFFLPWGIKNIVYTGNPVFPFFYDLFGYKNIPWNQESARNYFALLTEYSPGTIVDLILFPLNILFSPGRFGGGADILGNYGWIIFILFSPIALFLSHTSAFAKCERRVLFPINWLIGYSILHFLIWFFTKPVLRFLYPILPVVSIIAGYSIATILYRQKFVILKFLVLVVIFGLTISNFVIYFSIQDIIKPFGVAIGIVSRDEYLTKNLFASPYPVFKYINSNLSEKDKVFFVGEQRGFYCNKQYIASNVFAPNPLVEWANNSKDYKELISKMKEIGITHIFYNKREGERLRSYGIFNFSSTGEKNWNDLILYLKPIFSVNNLYLYKLD